jgi:hypothetical protein
MQGTFFNKRVVALAVAAAGLLIGCGGGGGGGTASVAAPTLSGLAATGAGIANAAVTAKCATGAPLTGTTDANGSFNLVLGGRTLPCMLQVTGGTPAVTLHSFAQAAGRVNITPVTDLIVAKALGADPGPAFASYAPSNGMTIETGLPAAKSYVTTQINNITGGSIVDPLAGAFAVGDADDKVLDALGNAMGAASVDIGALRTQLLSNNPLTATVPAYLAKPVALSATAASSTAINLSWTAVAGATGYKVYRATSAGVATSGAPTATSTTTTYSDSGLSASTAYYYQVVPTNTVVTAGTASDEASATTSAAGGSSGGGLVVGLNPNHGTVGSTVTIVGSGFGNSPQVKFYDEFLVSGTLIRTEVAATVVSSTATEIVVTVPPGANSGLVKVDSISVGTYTVDLPQVGAWTQQESMGGYSVATNGTRFVKVWSLSNVKQSVDGATWNDSFMYSSLNYMGGQVQWDGSQFVYIVSKDATSSPVQTVAVSPDGTNWTTKIAGQKLISWDPQYASSMRDFVAVSGRITLVGDKGGIATSTDGGTSWTLETYPVGYQDHQIWAVDDTGTQRIALTLSGDGGAALRSSGAGAWSAVATALDLKPADLLWTGTTHVATGATTGAGGGARVLRSSDGLTWSAANLPTAYATGAWRGVNLAKQDSVLWLLVYKLAGANAVGSVLLKSTDDGLNWSLDTDFGSDPVSSLAFGSNLWIAVGNKTYTRSAP